MFWAEMSVGAFVPGKMNSSPGGIWSQAERGRPKFLERISFCFLLDLGEGGRRETNGIGGEEFGC